MATITYTYPDDSRTRPTYLICNAIHVHRRLTWIICASIAFLSARHLLVEQNIHYPLQLYFNHIAVTGLVAFWPYWAWQDAQGMFHGRSQLWTLMRRETGLVTASVCFTSLTTICSLQAILHVQNLPTLVMMIMIAFFAEGLLLFKILVTSRTYAEYIRISLLAVAGAGLLSAEYRLTVPGLATSTSAVLFAGFARALWKTAIRRHPDVLAKGVDQTGQYVITGALVGVIWVLVFWKGDPIFTLDLDFRNLALLIINALSSALALKLGKSMLLPMDDTIPGTISQAVDALVHPTWDTLTLIILTGIVGCHSSLSIRRSYTNVYQFCCFLAAIVCIESMAYVEVSKAKLQSSWPSHSTYRLMNSSSASLAEGSDTVGLYGEASHLGMPTLLSNSRKRMFRTFLLGVSIVPLWMAYGVLNYTERPEHRSPVLLDRDYAPQLSIEIVLSMHDEPVNEVGKLIRHLRSMSSLSDSHVTIYIKNDKADNAYIKQQTKADDVITLPNIGREGETFLNHILNRWDSLARQTFFLQAGIHNPREFYTRISNYYSRSETGFLNLGWSDTFCSCKDCSDRQFWRDSTKIFALVHNRMYNSTNACGNILLSYKGQFIVSAKRIRGIHKDIYHSLWQAFVDNKSWAHQPKYLQGRPDSMSTPDFGYTMERMWNLLFQCYGANVAWKCPTLLSGWRMGGDIGDCQCFDE